MLYPRQGPAAGDEAPVARWLRGEAGSVKARWPRLAECSAADSPDSVIESTTNAATGPGPGDKWNRLLKAEGLMGLAAPSDAGSAALDSPRLVCPRYRTLA